MQDDIKLSMTLEEYQNLSVTLSVSLFVTWPLYPSVYPSLDHFAGVWIWVIILTWFDHQHDHGQANDLFSESGYRNNRTSNICNAACLKDDHQLLLCHQAQKVLHEGLQRCTGPSARQEHTPVQQTPRRLRLTSREGCPMSVSGRINWIFLE